MLWAKEIKRRDGYKCVIYGNSENVVAHRIITQRNARKVVGFSETLSNGITLCRTCHRASYGGSFNPKGSILQPLQTQGKKNTLQAHAADRGESLNGFVNRAIDEAVTRDKGGDVNA